MMGKDGKEYGKKFFVFNIFSGGSEWRMGREAGLSSGGRS